MIKYLISFLLFSSTCIASIGIGGFPYPGPGAMLPSPITYAATLTITDTSATGDTFTLNSIAYDATDSPVSVTNLPTATEQITYTGSNTASCTGDVTGTGPWTINASPATIGCTITSTEVTPDYSWNLLDNAASTTLLAQNGGVNGVLVNSGNTADIDTGSGLDLPSTGFVRAAVPTTVFTDGVYTIQGSFKYTDAIGTVPVLFGESSGSLKMYVTLHTSPLRLRVRLNGVDKGYTDISARNLLDGNVHVLRVVQDTTSFIIYEGSSESALTAAVTISDGQTPSTWGSLTWLAGVGDATSSWNGVISDWKIWNSAVTP